MFEIILTAMLRKTIFIFLLFVAYKIADHFEFKSFNTDEVICSDPKAISLLLGLISISIALA